ncbi:MAG: prepilin peptidase [Candidatus Micrarchaeota archaeon]|nr:prepilin peptidase [Candidatus Micrarchaeota archaeon]
MFESVKLAAALIGSSICALYDLKTSNMLDALAIAMIILGIGIHTYESIVTVSVEPLLSAVTVGLSFLAFGLFMYYRGYWGGGDGELLVAIGVLLPGGLTGDPLFSLNFFINTFIVGGIYSILYSFIVTRKNKKVKREFLKSVSEDRYYLLFFAFSSVLLFSVLSIFSNNPVGIVLGLLLASMPLVFKYARAVERHGFYRRIRTEDLKEGDVIGEDVPEAGVKMDVIRGLTKHEVNAIKKVRKFVIIREGVRYGPVFPLALVVSLLGFSPFYFI